MMDWSNMPGDLLELILSKLFGKDRDNFSLVCARWNKVRASSLHGKSPCLVFPNRASHSWRVYQHNVFSSTDFPIPNRNATIRCSKHGWLLMSRDDHTLFFFDFFNNQTIEVPDTPPRGFTSISFFHPPTSSECFIIGIRSVVMSPLKIGFLRHGEDEWKIGCIHLPKHVNFNTSLAPPILHNEKLHFLDVRGNLATLDTATIDMDGDQVNEHGYVFGKCNKQHHKHIRKIQEHFLLEPEGEDTVFAVFVMHADGEVRVFKLLEDNVWEGIHDLGDRVFYVSNASSFGYTTNNKTMANKIFFPKFHGDKIVFYSLDTQKYHSFDGEYSSENPDVLKKFELATWVRPTPIPHFSRELLTWCS